MDLDILDAVVHYADGAGYKYVGISDAWKRLCLDLPDSTRVQVPPVYRQQYLHTTINNQPCVIQAWRGDCPQLYRELPGGIGGEVGIYRTIPNKQIPDVLTLPGLSHFPPALRPLLTKVVSRILKDLVETTEHGTEWWWPFPELNAKIEMRFLHPDRDEELFHADPAEPAGGYWMSRWMGYGSYARYVLHETFHGKRVPLHAYDYRMEFSVGPQKFVWDSPGGPIVPV